MNNYDFLTINFAPCVGIVFLLIFLYYNQTLDQSTKKTFYALIILEFIESVAFSLELYTSTLPEATIFRTIFSAIGYTLRPVLIYLIFRISIRKWDKKLFNILMVIPLIINALLSFSALFTDIVFTYTADNGFVRGPLGQVPNIIIVIYVLFIVLVILKKNPNRQRLETIILVLCLLLIVGSIIVEALLGYKTIGRTAMVMATICYYMYFQTANYTRNMAEVGKISRTWESQAKTDGLTGILNKKAFLAELDRIQHNGWNQGTVLVFFDLDYFKEINDRLGHLVGDKVLVDFAHKLERIFADTDYICRFGGDEFCVYMEDVSESRLQNLLEMAVVALQGEYGNGDDRITLTTSIGAAYLPDGGMLETKQLLDMADSAVYRAKEGGRNQYMVQIRTLPSM